MNAVLQALVALLLFALATVAQAQPRDFDHLRTGFALSGAHTNARCESCHVSGQFKGTPRDCESCHTAGARLARGNVVKTPEHLSTQQSCSTCHTTRTFAGARMNHSMLPRGTCTTCHNGVQASAKPATHLRTSASCDSCHSSQAWRPATGFDHAGVVPGTCSSCHNGIQATGRGAGHTPYWLVGATASAGCDSCHRAGFKSWTPARVHGGTTITAQCSACHTSNKPNTAVHVGQTACENCHRSSTTWAGAKVDHANFTVATNCASCHNGSSASGKNAGHIPVGLSNCISCHRGSFTTWANGRYHANVATPGSCKSCHTGPYASQGAVGKPANHIPESQLLNGAAMECSACHTSTSSWTTLRMDHNNSLGGGAGWCKGCHLSGTAYAGSLDRKSLTHKTKTPPAVDCSESGCHRPLGNKGTTYRNWD